MNQKVVLALMIILMMALSGCGYTYRREEVIIDEAAIEAQKNEGTKIANFQENIDWLKANPHYVYIPVGVILILVAGSVIVKWRLSANTNFATNSVVQEEAAILHQKAMGQKVQNKREETAVQPKVATDGHGFATLTVADLPDKVLIAPSGPLNDWVVVDKASGVPLYRIPGISPEVLQLPGVVTGLIESHTTIEVARQNAMAHIGATQALADAMREMHLAMLQLQPGEKRDEAVMISFAELIKSVKDKLPVLGKGSSTQETTGGYKPIEVMGPDH